MEKGLLIILSGPSGVGKGTVRKHLVNSHPELDIHYSISMTTRLPRNGELNGIDYFFVSNEEFDENIKRDNFLEYSAFVGNRYGTPKDYVLDLVHKGNNVLIEIETNGAAQVMEKLKGKEPLVSIFLTASLEKLKDRIINRKTETADIIEERLNKAKKEFDKSVLYDFVVENNEIEQAANDIYKIIIEAKNK